MLKTTQKLCPVAMLVFVLFFLRTYELNRKCVSFECLFLPCSVKVGNCGTDTYITKTVTLNYVGQLTN